MNVFLTSERTHVHGLGLHALRFALALALAFASYYLLEQPIRRHGVPFSRPQYIVPAAVALAVFLVVHSTYAEGRPAPSTSALSTPELPPSPPEVVRFRISMFGDSTANSLGWSLRMLHPASPSS